MSTGVMPSEPTADRNAVRRPTEAAIRILRRVPLGRLGWLLLLALLSAMVLLPLWRLLQQPAAEGLAPFARLADIHGISKTLQNTVVLALGSVAVAVPLGVGLAWLAYRSPRRVKGIVAAIPVLPLVIPSVAAVVGWGFLLSPEIGYINLLLRRLPFFDGLQSGPLDIYTISGIVLLTGYLLTSFVYLFVYGALRNLNPDYLAAAEVSGSGATRAFFTVVVPLLRPSIVYSTAIVLLLGLGQFTVPLLLGSRRNIRVLTMEMFTLTQQFPIDYALGGALALPLVVAAVFIVIAQRRALRNEANYAGTAGSGRGSESKGSWLSASVVLAYGVVTLVLPLAALTYVAVSPYWRADLTLSGLTTQHLTYVMFENSGTRAAIFTSITAAGLAALIALPIGFLVSLAIVRFGDAPGWIRTLLDLVSMVPLAMPAAVFGFAILFAYAGPPFSLYGTITIIVLAYVILMTPHSVRAQLSTISTLPHHNWEASRISGAGPLRTVFQVVLPLSRQGVAAALVIMIVLLFHEFGASLMVRSARSQVMGTILFDLWSGGVYPQVAAIALVMTVVTFAGLSAAVAVAGRNALMGLKG